MLDLDYVIIEAITNLAIDPAYIEQVRANKPKNDVSEKVKTINAEVEKVETKISRLMDLYADGQIDMAAISNKVSALNAEKTALKKELDSLDIPDTENAGMSNEQIQQLADLINDKDLDLTERRAIVQSLVYYVEIDNEDIIIHWKF
jgi:site-specific DNA recombinase